MTTDLRQQISEMREVRRLDLAARAAAALDNPTLLDGLDEDGLGEVEELIAGRERAAAAAAEVERRARLVGRIWQAGARRLAAIERAEAALADLVEALAEGEAARVTIAQLASALPVPLPAPLESSETALMASRHIATALARLGSASRFGSIQFPQGLVLGATGGWSAAARRLVERFASSIAEKNGRDSE